MYKLSKYPNKIGEVSGLIAPLKKESFNLRETLRTSDTFNSSLIVNIPPIFIFFVICEISLTGLSGISCCFKMYEVASVVSSCARSISNIFVDGIRSFIFSFPR